MSNRPFYRYGGHIEFDLRSIIGCPGGISTFRLYFERFSGHFFLKFSQNQIVTGKKIFVPCLDVIMIAFFQFSIRNMVFHDIFLGKKAIIITFKHGTRILLPITILFLENIKKKCPKSPRKYKRNVLTPPGQNMKRVVIG